LVFGCVACALGAGTARAQDKREPVAVIGLRPASKTVNGPLDMKKLGESERLRRVFNDAVRDASHRPIIDDSALRSTLGVEYVVDFVECRGEVACVSRLAHKLTKFASTAVYGGYAVVDKDYVFHLRLVDLAQAKILKEIDFKLDTSDIEDRKLWQRAIEPMFATPEAAKPVEEKTEPPANKENKDNTESTEAKETTENKETKDKGGVTELAPITSSGPEVAEADNSSGGGEKGGAYIDTSVLDAIARGVALHGYTENYLALGFEAPFARQLEIFEQRLQLEFESDIKEVRVVGKPQLIYDIANNKFDVAFREIYAARDYKRVDFSVGEQIVTWGVTDFWPVVDIINPRNLFQIRNWRPIDEKLPAPILQARILLGALTWHLLAVPYMGMSTFQLDHTQPFALPVTAISGLPTPTEYQPPARFTNVGGGTRVDIALSSFKLSLYGLIGRDPLPAIYVQLDPSTFAASVTVDNDRVAMGAASLQGNVAGAIVRAEGAVYDRLDDRCAGAIQLPIGAPSCFYVRRVPTFRTNASIEHKLFPGLDAHLQFISEVTTDVPQLPPLVGRFAPGFPPQSSFNKIFTLRLQGDFMKSDFRPMVFAYWSLEDQAFFVNTDLEYHLADGFALALGEFWFRGYASDPNKNLYTFAGGFAGSSYAYLRATAWF
jgi:hypothetical protein